MLRSSEIDKIEKEVKGIISTVFDIEESKLTRETRFLEDLFAKSVQILELLAMLEYKFKLEIPMTEVRKNKTVGQAIDYMVRRLKESSK